MIDCLCCETLLRPNRNSFMVGQCTPSESTSSSASEPTRYEVGTSTRTMVKQNLGVET